MWGGAVGLALGLGVSQTHFSRSSSDDDDDDKKVEYHAESGCTVAIGSNAPLGRLFNV